MSAARDLMAGFATVTQAVRLLSADARLRRWAAAPTLLSILLFAVAVWLAVRYAPGLVERWWPTVDATGWRAALAGAGHALAKLAAIAVGLVLAAAVFWFGSRLLAEPFIDPLIEATERALGHQATLARWSLGGLARSLLFTLGDVVLDLALFGVAQVLAVALLLVPVAGGALSAVAGWLIGVWFAALEMSSGTLIRGGRRGLARWRSLARRRWLALGLGAGVTLLLVVPLAQLLTLPVAVVAGTIAALEILAGEND